MARGRQTISQRQYDVLTYITDYRAVNGYSPTLYEVGGELGIAPGRAQRIAAQLVRKGYLRRTVAKYRNLVPSIPVERMEAV